MRIWLSQANRSSNKIAWRTHVTLKFSCLPHTVRNLPREAKNIKQVWYFPHGLARRISHPKFAANARKRLSYLPREEFCSALYFTCAAGLSDEFDFVAWSEGPPVKGNAITVVISPLNALIRDQIGKLGHIRVHILDGTKKSIDLAKSLASHPEIILEKNTKLFMLKTPVFQKNVRCICCGRGAFSWRLLRAFQVLEVPVLC